MAPSQALGIFVKSLSACLTNESVKVTWWHDPSSLPLTKEAAVSSEWADYIKRYSAVVIAHPHPDYDLDFIRQQHPHVIDASAMLAESIAPPDAYNQNVASQPVELPTHAGQMDVVYTGVVPVVYKAQRTLLVSLIESVAWAFVLIAGVMACLLSPARTFLGAFQPHNVLQSLCSGAVSMLPNVFPLVIIFGAMGHMGTLVDIGTMMTASVAMGVAVDDTIHFLTWFRDGLKKGLDRKQAIYVAYKHVAPAMTQTTIIAGVGLSVFAMSTFTPTQRFGTLMLTLLGAALVGDLIFLPAILASPVGRLFMLRAAPQSDRSGRTELELLDAQAVNLAPRQTVIPMNAAVASETATELESAIKPPNMLKAHSAHVRRRV